MISLSSFKRIQLDECSSTNIVMYEMISNDAKLSNTIITADFQTAGKGHESNLWHSEKGKNLIFSLVIKPEQLEAGKQFQLTKAVSLGVHDALKALLPKANITIKWPNDIYIDAKKVGGILISNIIAGNTIRNSIIGIGLNVNQTEFPADIPNPVSVKQITGKDTDRDHLLDRLCLSLSGRLEELLNGKHSETIDQDYLRSLYRFGQQTRFQGEGRTFDARIVNVNQYGHLILEVDSGELRSFDLKQLIFR